MSRINVKKRDSVCWEDITKQPQDAAVEEIWLYSYGSRLGNGGQLICRVKSGGFECIHGDEPFGKQIAKTGDFAKFFASFFS